MACSDAVINRRSSKASSTAGHDIRRSGLATCCSLYGHCRRKRRPEVRSHIKHLPWLMGFGDGRFLSSKPFNRHRATVLMTARFMKRRDHDLDRPERASSEGTN